MTHSGTATTTVVYADVEGGTGGMIQESADLLRAVFSRFGGEILETADDAVVAVFAAASDAVAAGVALQRRLAHERSPLQLALGIDAGDVSWDHGSCFGQPTVVARRLATGAPPGRVQVSSVVRLMAGSRAGASYRHLGTIALDGLDAAVDAFDVDCGDDPVTEAAWPFPATLPVSDRPFVGRRDESAVLRRAWQRTVAGGNEIVLIGGEAGAGKTRLATETARELHASGAIVLSGLNDSELSLPYQPWVMVIDQLLHHLPPAVLQDLSTELAALRVLDARIERHVAGLGRLDPVEPEAQRHLVLQGLAALLAAAAGIAPTVLVLDDLHWAGQQTLDVLRYVARTAPVGQLLVIGTFRDTSDAAGARLSATLADLRRFERTTRVKLTGLDLESVLELVAASRSGANGDIAELAAVVARRTGGNPFLVWELCAHLDESTGAPVPDSVIEVVGARIRRLSPDARTAAEVIAVAANRVPLTVLGDAAALDGGELATAITELVDSGLVDEVTGPVPEYQYAHALLRDAVVAPLSGPSRMHLHLDLARAIERAHEADRRSVLPELARHYAASAAVGGRDKAVYYGARAAAQARQTAAYDEGVSVLRTVLDAMPGSGPDQIDLALDLIDLLQRSGHHLESLAVGRSTFGDARAMGDVARQAEVALQCERVNHLAGGGGPEINEMLELVLAEMGDGDERTHVRLRSALGRVRSLAGDDGADALMESALREARELGDEGALALAIEVSFLGSQGPDVQLARSYELEKLTTSLRDPWATMWATANRIRVLLVMGRLAEAEAELRAHRDVAYRHRFFLFQFMSCVLESVLHLAAGAFEQAEAAAEEAEAIGLSDEGLSGSGIYGLLMFSIRREQGRLEEMRPVLSLLARTGQHAAVWAPGAALAAAELGLLDEARSSFDAVAPDRFCAVPRDNVWPAALTFLSETALLLDAREQAEELIDELAPYGGQALMAGFTTSFGPTDRLRSALGELIGRPDDADRLLGAARELAARAGSPVWMARVEYTQSWILAGRGDAVGAARHHEAASRLGEPLGMAAVREPPAVAVRDRRSPATGAPPGGLSPREADVLALIAQGCTNREIAERLLISPNTAANHVRSILQKTGCANRAEAAAQSVRSALLPGG